MTNISCGYSVFVQVAPVALITISFSSSMSCSPGYNFPLISQVGYPGTSRSLQTLVCEFFASLAHSTYFTLANASIPNVSFCSRQWLHQNAPYILASSFWRDVANSTASEVEWAAILGASKISSCCVGGDAACAMGIIPSLGRRVTTDRANADANAANPFCTERPSSSISLFSVHASRARDVEKAADAMQYTHSPRIIRNSTDMRNRLNAAIPPVMYRSAAALKSAPSLSTSFTLEEERSSTAEYETSPNSASGIGPTLAYELSRTEVHPPLVPHRTSDDPKSLL
mmetsp:Transcript_44699/g.52368  ORF Transcript_44699/g.52368 Transcript_44699/m.52368 type:complete len:285 (-) Transcript_44699:580-1434(-)